jgi:hypothetical protein
LTDLKMLFRDPRTLGPGPSGLVMLAALSPPEPSDSTTILEVNQNSLNNFVSGSE